MSRLFEPIRVGNIEMKNRFMRSATYYALADRNGFIGERSVDLMNQLAAHDVGLIVTGYAYVQENGQCFVDMNGIQDDEHIPGYERMTRAVHDNDGRIVMQIAHGGVNSTAVDKAGGDLVAVSVPEDLPKGRTRPRELTEEDIEGMVDAFGQAAARVQEAGFDGVQIHGAHGYLVTQFLSPQSNRRTDKWGGSLENRMRFVVAVTRAMKDRVGDDFPVMIKLGCRDYSDHPQRLTIEDGVETAKKLESEGHCHIEVSHGVVDTSHGKMAAGVTTTDREAYMAQDARALREAVGIPLGLVGGMRTPSVMEQLLEEDAVDTLSICRPLIREPDLIQQWKSGSRKSADCISCGRCFRRKDGKILIACSQLEA